MLPALKAPGRPGTPGSIFADESGQNLRPPKGRTWSRKGRTPVLPVAYREERAGLDRRADLRQTGDADAADLPHAYLPPS